MEIKTYEQMILDNHKIIMPLQYKEYSVILKQKWVKVEDIKDIPRSILYEVLEECLEDHNTKMFIQEKFNKRLNFELN